MIPVFWELVAPAGATITMVGGQTLGNMQMAHALRISFPAESQKDIAAWLQRTADFLASLPQGQSMQVPPPAPLQAAPQAQPEPAPMMHYPQAQYAAPPPVAAQPVPAPMGHNVPPPPVGIAPIGHNNVPMPAAFGGVVQQPAPQPEVSQVTPPAPTNPNFEPGPERPRPANPPPTIGHVARMPQVSNPHVHVMGEDDQQFAQMSPVNAARPPAVQPAAGAAPPQVPTSQPVRHTWDGPYAIGRSRCTRCQLVATGTENKFCAN